MCTAATYQTKDFYFGRNLDYEFPYGEEVCIVPRSFPIPLRHLPALQTHYAMIGMAHVEDGFPLFYDAVNETGLCIAGLNFVGNAAYAEPTDGKTNVAQFELIEWLLGTCRNLEQARRALAGCNLVGTPFSGKLPTAQLHWLIADETGAIVLESMADGLHLYENPTGVLTNNPPFPMQLFAPAGQPLFQRPFAPGILAGHGRNRSAGRSVVAVALPPRSVHEAQRQIR